MSDIEITPEEAAPPASPVAAGDDPGLSLDDMSDAQIDAIRARIEERQQNRPASIAAQLEELSAKFDGTLDEKNAAVNQRRAASASSDELVAALDSIKADMRKIELREAVTAAGFAKVDQVVGMLAGTTGDTADLVASAAASGAFVMKTPATSAPIGGQLSQDNPKMDPGRAAFIKQLNEVQNG